MRSFPLRGKQAPTFHLYRVAALWHPLIFKYISDEDVIELLTSQQTRNLAWFEAKTVRDELIKELNQYRAAVGSITVDQVVDIVDFVR